MDCMANNLTTPQEVPTEAQADPSAIISDMSEGRRATAPAMVPAQVVKSAADPSMILVSEPQLREIVRQEIESVLKNKGLKDWVGMAAPSSLDRIQTVIRDADKLLDPVSPLTPNYSLGGPFMLRSPSHQTTHSQASLIDEKWGVLFEGDQPTKRAEDVFGGLAEYIICEFAPKKSLVITPEKLLRFYSQYRLHKEVFPFSAIFDASVTEEIVHGRIADLYEDLECQYHLVQKDVKSRPTIPGLTPLGFARWLLLNLQAHPEEEAQRLKEIALATPISVENTTDCKMERMPRVISRHLLPEHPNMPARKRLHDALQDFVDNRVPTLVSPPRPYGQVISPAQWLRDPRASGSASHHSATARYTPTPTSAAQSPAPTSGSGLLSPAGPYASLVPGMPPSPSLSAARERSPRYDRESEYHGSQRQVLYVPAHSSRGGSLDSGAPAPRRSGSYRDRERERDRERDRDENRHERGPSPRRRHTASAGVDDGRGQTWDEYLRQKGSDR